MKLNGTVCRKPGRKSLCLLLAAGMLLFQMTVPDALAEPAREPIPELYDSETILAMDALKKLEVLDDSGRLLEIRSGRELRGRGIPDAESKEPDYTGVVGYAAIPNEPAFSESPKFPSYLWMIPVYEDSEGSISGQYGQISHKTPLVAVGQQLKLAEDGMYKGYVRAIRLDRQEFCWVDVHCFVTLPYWKMKISDASAYGYCLAVFREGSRDVPRTPEGEAVSFRDGTRILIPFRGAVAAVSPDPEKLPVLGIAFRKTEGGTVPVPVFFNEQDLALTY